MNLFLLYVALASSFVPVIAGVMMYRNLNKGTVALLILVVVNCCQMMTSYVLSLMKIHNLELLNDYRPVELVMIASVFGLMVGERSTRKLLLWCTVGFILIWIADKIYLDNPGQLNSRMAMLSRFVAVIMSIVVLYTGAKGSKGSFAERPLFWVGTAVLLYSSGTTVVLGLSQYLVNMELDTFINAWQINWILLVLANLFYTKGFLCKPQRPT